MRFFKMRNNAGHGAVEIAPIIVPIIACSMTRQTKGLNDQKRGLGLVVSRRDPHLTPHDETDPLHIFIFGSVCQPVRGRADDFCCFKNTISPLFQFYQH